MRIGAAVRWGGLLLVPCLLVGCTEPDAQRPSSDPTPSDAQGGSGQGRGTSEADPQVGFRIENTTGAPITLTFRDGTTGTVATGGLVRVLRCAARLPIRATDEDGRLLDVRRHHCQGETWVVKAKP